MEKILKVENLNVSFHTYAGEVKAVRGVDFDLNKGETLGIVGESGCGKSVTVKSIMKLLPENSSEIKEGSKIIFYGVDLIKLKEKEMQKIRGSDLAMIFQDPMTFLNPTMRVGNQIAENLIVHKNMNKKDAFQESINMLETVRIPNPDKRAKQYPHELSGGMRQRVMIAIALACSPKILIADEPTTALDVTIQAQIMELMKELQEKFSTSIILVTHDLGVVAGIADRINVMYAGQILEKGTASEIFYNPQNPYTWALLRSVPGVNTKNKQKLYSLRGTPPDLIKPPIGCAFSARCEYCMRICKELKPNVTKISDTQEVYCWLKHPMAPIVKNQFNFGGEN